MLKARFTLTYRLIVLAVFAGLIALAWYLLVTERAGSVMVPEAGGVVLSFSVGAIKLAGLALIAVAMVATQLWDLLFPRDILTLTPQGLHDRRLTRGPILWSQIETVHLYRKGWQWMALIETKPLTVTLPELGLGPMPLYAFNRLCARWQKKPELNVGLGGLTMSTEAIATYLRQHSKACGHGNP